MDLLLALPSLFGAAVLVGLAGSYLGIGGGIFLIPFMTLVLGVDIKIAAATSLVGVIATSSGSGSVYVRDHLTNLRLGMFLEVGTTSGAVAGAVTAILIPQAALFVVFGAVAMVAAGNMVRRPESARDRAYKEAPVSAVSERLKLDGSYFDIEDQGVYRYRVARPRAGFGISMAAGGLSGLLGVGGGFIKVPAMNVVMGVPMKVAVATSNFMIGVTAAASAFIYYSEGYLNPSLAGAIVIGVFAGTLFGTKMMMRAKARRIRFVFAVLLAATGVFMILRPFLPGVGF